MQTSVKIYINIAFFFAKVLHGIKKNYTFASAFKNERYLKQTLKQS